MNQEQLNSFEKKLLQMRKEILEESDHTRYDMKEENSLFSDSYDRASLETDRNTILRIRDRERKLLLKIEEALERVHNHTFGFCLECEENIPYERLNSRPVTTLCIACKEKQEQGEKF